MDETCVRVALCVLAHQDCAITAHTCRRRVLSRWQLDAREVKDYFQTDHTIASMAALMGSERVGPALMWHLSECLGERGLPVADARGAPIIDAFNPGCGNA